MTRSLVCQFGVGRLAINAMFSLITRTASWFILPLVPLPLSPFPRPLYRPHHSGLLLSAGPPSAQHFLTGWLSFLQCIHFRHCITISAVLPDEGAAVGLTIACQRALAWIHVSWEDRTDSATIESWQVRSIITMVLRTLLMGKVISTIWQNSPLVMAAPA